MSRKRRLPLLSLDVDTPIGNLRQVKKLDLISRDIQYSEQSSSSRVNFCPASSPQFFTSCQPQQPGIRDRLGRDCRDKLRRHRQSHEEDEDEDARHEQYEEHPHSWRGQIERSTVEYTLPESPPLWTLRRTINTGNPWEEPEDGEIIRILRDRHRPPLSPPIRQRPENESCKQPPSPVRSFGPAPAPSRHQLENRRRRFQEKPDEIIPKKRVVSLKKGPSRARRQSLKKSQQEITRGPQGEEPRHRPREPPRIDKIPSLSGTRNFTTSPRHNQNDQKKEEPRRRSSDHRVSVRRTVNEPSRRDHGGRSTATGKDVPRRNHSEGPKNIEEEPRRRHSRGRSRTIRTPSKRNHAAEGVKRITQKSRGRPVGERAKVTSEESRGRPIGEEAKSISAEKRRRDQKEQLKKAEEALKKTDDAIKKKKDARQRRELELRSHHKKDSKSTETSAKNSRHPVASKKVYDAPRKQSSTDSSRNTQQKKKAIEDLKKTQEKDTKTHRLQDDKPLQKSTKIPSIQEPWLEQPLAPREKEKLDIEVKKTLANVKRRGEEKRLQQDTQKVLAEEHEPTLEELERQKALLEKELEKCNKFNERQRKAGEDILKLSEYVEAKKQRAQLEEKCQNIFDARLYKRRHRKVRKNWEKRREKWKTQIQIRAQLRSVQSHDPVQNPDPPSHSDPSPLSDPPKEPPSSQMNENEDVASEPTNSTSNILADKVKMETPEVDTSPKILPASELNSLLILALHKLFTTPNNHLGILENFEIFYSDCSTNTHLNGGFELQFKNSRQSFDPHLDLPTILNLISTQAESEFVQLKTSGESQFGEVLSNLNLIFKNAPTVTTVPLLECLKGHIWMPDTATTPPRLLTLNRQTWTYFDNDKETPNLGVHFWFNKFLSRNYHPAEYLREFITVGTNGHTLLTNAQETDKYFFAPPARDQEQDLYDFMEIRHTGQIFLYFTSNNFTRQTTRIMDRMGSTVYNICTGDEDETRKYFNVFLAKFPLGHDPIYKTYEDYIKNLKTATLVYLHAVPGIEGHPSKLEREVNLVTKMDRKFIENWLRMPENLLTAFEKQFIANSTSSNVDQWLSGIIFLELLNQDFIEEDGTITLKALYCQKEHFKFLRLDKLKGQFKPIAIEMMRTKLFQIFLRVKSGFPIQEPILQLKEAEELLMEEQFGCKLNIKVSEFKIL